MPDTHKPIDQKESCTLVGEFLQAWGTMEAQLNRVIGTILGLGDIQTSIVCKNIQFRDKIHITRTAVNESALAKDKKTVYDEELKKLADFSYDRNMVAHDQFRPSDDQMGVLFVVIRAKGELKFPETIWSRKDFGDRVEKAKAFCQTLKALNSDANALAQAIASLASPMPWLLGRGHLFDPIPPHQASPHSDIRPANERKDDETPPSSQE